MTHPLFDVVVVGSGVWGESAREAFQRSGKSVCLIHDQNEVDHRAASDDVARIVRAEYSDQSYRRLAERAIQVYRTKHPYVEYYHEPGWYLFQDGKDERYESIPASDDHVSVETFLSQFPAAAVHENAIITTSSQVGWVEADDLQGALREADSSAVRIRGKVTGLLRRKTACYGVQLEDEEVYGTQVVVAAGWRTNELLKAGNVPILPYDIVGAVVLGVQLNQEQYDRYKDKKIICDPGHGEVIPPTREKILRINSAYTFMFDDDTTAAPSVTSSHPCFEAPKAFLKQYCPDLSDCPVVIARICLDALTEGQTFYIERHHGLSNLHCIGGGSFHSWKFRPVLPDLLASQLGLQGEDSIWHALSQRDRHKHIGVVPTRRWKETF